MSDYESAEMCKEEKQAMQEIANHMKYQSGLAFLNGHNGWRDKNLHLLISTAHGGKSTAIRTIAIDFVGYNQNVKMGVWLSEETKDAYKTELTWFQGNKGFDRINLFSEKDYGVFRGTSEILSKMESFIDDLGLNFLVVDNITTSQAYNGSDYKTQVKFGYELNRLANRKGIPILLVAHTKGTITENYDGIIEMEHMEGAKIYTKLVEFCYILQGFHLSDRRVNTLRITKHRGQEIPSRLYKLTYEPKYRIFVGDNILTFSDFKRIFKDRDRL